MIRPCRFREILLRSSLLPPLAVAAIFVAGIFLGSHLLDWNCFHAAWWGDPIFRLRLVRMLGALTVGAGLAVSGTVFQAVLRNPLAEPFTLGLSGGAGVGAALAFVLGLRAWSIYAVPLMALAGALAILTVVLLVARRADWGHESLLLSGVISGTVASSILVYILSVADNDQLAGVTWWMLGDLQAVDLDFLLPGVAVLAAALLLLRGWAGHLNALALGDENAWVLGVDYRIFSVVFIVIAALLAATTVAMAGLIAFVGLVIPHMVRRLYGCDHRRIIALAAWYGGGFLMLCDIVSRSITPAREIPIGVITALIGGPLFLKLLTARR